jgi:hypothetical protein
MDSPLPASKPQRGRPKSSKKTARPNRIVTFVTDAELRQLKQVANDEERSMAAVVHRIIARYFPDK